MRRPYLAIIITGLLILYQLGYLLRLFQLPEAISENIVPPVTVQVGITILWLAGLTWASRSLWIMSKSGKQRSLWLIYGFGVYIIIRQAVFTQADYDRQRIPFVVFVGLFFTIIFILFRLLRIAGTKMEKNQWQ